MSALIREYDKKNWAHYKICWFKKKRYSKFVVK